MLLVPLVQLVAGSIPGRGVCWLGGGKDAALPDTCRSLSGSLICHCIALTQAPDGGPDIVPHFEPQGPSLRTGKRESVKASPSCGPGGELHQAEREKRSAAEASLCLPHPRVPENLQSVIDQLRLSSPCCPGQCGGGPLTLSPVPLSRN